MLTCLHCSWTWWPRPPDHRPAQCPRCKSRKWDVNNVAKLSPKPLDNSAVGVQN